MIVKDSKMKSITFNGKRHKLIEFDGSSFTRVFKTKDQKNVVLFVEKRDSSREFMLDKKFPYCPEITKIRETKEYYIYWMPYYLGVQSNQTAKRYAKQISNLYFQIVDNIDSTDDKQYTEEVKDNFLYDLWELHIPLSLKETIQSLIDSSYTWKQIMHLDFCMGNFSVDSQTNKLILRDVFYPY
jgi:hypothetical protein